MTTTASKVGGPKSMAIKKKAQKERIYMIFAILTFYGREAKNDI